MNGMVSSLRITCLSIENNRNEAEMKQLEEYQLIVSDMDGTLYYQRSLQVIMALQLVFSLGKKNGISELYMVYLFRKLREGCTDREDADQKLYETVAKKTGRNAAQVQAVIQKWIYQKPLQYLACCQDLILIERLSNLQKEHKEVAIYSDYPAQEKAKQLKLADIPCFYGGQPEISAFKPDPRGIRYIMSQYGIEDPRQVILIGDRMSRDGQAARQAGIDYVIVKKYKWQRKGQYRKWYRE